MKAFIYYAFTVCHSSDLILIPGLFTWNEVAIGDVLLEQFNFPLLVSFHQYFILKLILSFILAIQSGLK